MSIYNSTIDREHLIELTRQYVLNHSGMTISIEQVEEHISKWRDLKGSEEAVYNILCQELQVSPRYCINKSIQLKRCDCGAKHTSFPNHHFDWCSVHGGIRCQD